MATPARKAKYTYQDYLLFPDDGNRHELIGGEHYVSPAPSRRHQKTVGNFHFHLRLFLEQNPLGEVLLAPFDVILSDWMSSSRTFSSSPGNAQQSVRRGEPSALRTS